MLTYISKARQGWVSGEHPGYQAYYNGMKISPEEENELRNKLGLAPVDSESDEAFQKWFNKQFAPAIEAYNKAVEERGTFSETVASKEPEGEKYEVHVLEFDWAYGHRKDECSSKEEAEKRLEKWQKTFYWAEFSNVKIYHEIRYRTKIVDVENLLTEKETEEPKPDIIETAEDLAKISGTFAAEMKSKKKGKKKNVVRTSKNT